MIDGGRVADGSRWIERRAVTGAAIVASGYTVTPLSSALIVRLPFGAAVWHRPTAVLVEHAGYEERLPIRNVTRAAQLALSCAVLAVSIVLQGRVGRRKEQPQ